MAQEKLEIIIEAVNKASGVIKDVDESFGRLNTVLSAGAMGMAAMAAINLGKELATLGAQASRVEAGFRNIAGADAGAFMDKLRISSRGAIDDMSLMLSANKAMLLGVSQNADELGRLMEIARVRGAAMGLSTQQAFSDIVTGIGRMSPLILDNLGILTGGTKTFEAYAKSMGRTAESLTDAEKRQALLNKVLEDSVGSANAAGGAAADAATSFESLAAQITNFKTEMGKQLAEGSAPISAGAAGFLGRWNEINRAIDDYREAMQRADPAAYAARILEQQGAIGNLARQYQWGRISLDEFKAGLDNLLPSYGLQVSGIAEWSAALATLAGMQATALQGQQELTRKRELERIQAATPMDSWLVGRTETSGRNMVTTNADRLRKDEEATSDVMRRMEAASRASAKSLKSGASEREAEMKRQASEMRSLIEGLLQPTKVTDLDMAQTKLGTYTDKWDEYIRRIRAGAQDAKSQWRNLIPTDVLAQGQDAVNAWVASTEKAFYAGQAPDQINWDAFIGQAREQLAQKQARENLIAEAGRRLAAAGIGGGVQAAELLGLGGGGAGMDTEGLVQGVASSGVGITISATITDQIKGQGEVWSQTGAICMSAFLTGAQGAITPETGQKFIGAIWPWLAPLVKNVANQGYRQ